ncbi:S28 family serine protease [Helicobacter fennelliae]|uniref:Fungal lipase-like domain-containing protein n=1 Tax=Helicobacter fennelliae MRY12-0050 TaxID=1325130 RepID=T1CP83_9HELI|nr:S28 family serine protease [Helicobacter fennelliae]GAD18579.1 hypothetical protein HFN_1991 [Helicobacter fennelliae MRY12-0050]STP14487.1 putative lipase [Helicobacter fennelliae]
MPHNQIPNNQDIMLDSNANLLLYEAHIRLMYRYAILALAGNVKLTYFMEARKRNDYTDVKKDLDIQGNKIQCKIEKIATCLSLLDEYNKSILRGLSDSQKMLFLALVRSNKDIGDKIPVGGLKIFYKIPKTQEIYVDKIAMTIALNFAKNYEVIDHINENDRESKMGFRATLFRDIRNNEYVLGIAGTDAPSPNPLTVDWKDIGTDASLTLRKLPKKQYDSMINFYFRLKQSGKIAHNTPIVVVGHSLGGYLAQLFALTYPHITHGLYTYQAPGAKRLWRGIFSFLQSLNIKARDTQTDMREHRKQAYKNLSRANRQEAMNILKDKTFHIHTDKDSNLNNNQWILLNFVQELGTKTPGYLYYINDKNNDFHHPAHCVRALERLNRLLDVIHHSTKTQMNLQDLNLFLRNLYHYSLLHKRGETLSEAIDCVLDDVAYYQNLIEMKSIDFLQDRGLEPFAENQQIYIMPLRANDFTNIPLDSLNKLDLGYLRSLVKSQAYRLIAHDTISLLNFKNISYFLGYNASTYKIYQNGLDDFSLNAYIDRFHLCIEQGETHRVVFKEELLS